MKKKTLVIIAIIDTLLLLSGLYFLLPTISKSVNQEPIVNELKFRNICFDVGWENGEDFEDERLDEESIKIVTFPETDRTVSIFLDSEGAHELTKEEWKYLKSPFTHRKVERSQTGIKTEDGNTILKTNLLIYEKGSFRVILREYDILGQDQEKIQSCVLTILREDSSITIMPSNATKEDCLKIIRTVSECN